MQGTPGALISCLIAAAPALAVASETINYQGPAGKGRAFGQREQSPRRQLHAGQGQQPNNLNATGSPNPAP
jgi:hypothetical protein